MLQEINPLSPNSDANETSLYIINTCSNIQAVSHFLYSQRIKKVITKDKMSWYLDNSPY